MTNYSKKQSWNTFILALLLLAIAIFANTIFSAQSSGDLADRGKHGLYLFKKYMHSQGRNLESFDMGEHSEEALSFQKGIYVHLVPYESLGYSIEQHSAIADRIAYLKKESENGAQNALHLIYALDFDFKSPELTYNLVRYPDNGDISVINAYILQNKVLPFERQLVARFVQTLDSDVRQLSGGMGAQGSAYRLLYHGDVLDQHLVSRHWFLELPLVLQLCILQFLIVMAFFFSAKGRTFGFPLRDIEESEPTPMAYVRVCAQYFKRYRLHGHVMALYKGYLKGFRSVGAIETKTFEGQPKTKRALYHQVYEIERQVTLLKKERKQLWQLKSESLRKKS